MNTEQNFMTLSSITKEIINSTLTLEKANELILSFDRDREIYKSNDLLEPVLNEIFSKQIQIWIKRKKSNENPRLYQSIIQDILLSTLNKAKENTEQRKVYRKLVKEKILSIERSKAEYVKYLEEDFNNSPDSPYKREIEVIYTNSKDKEVWNNYKYIQI